MKKRIIKSGYRKILVFTLSNFGDVVLTLPILTSLRKQCPNAEIDCLVGSKVYDFLNENRFFKKVISYDKKARFSEKWKLFKMLSAEKYDFILDFRNSMVPYLLAKPSGSLSLNRALKKIDSRYKRYEALRTILQLPETDTRLLHLYTSLDCERLTELLRSRGVYSLQNIFLISPGARSHLKRWKAQYFAHVANAVCAQKELTVILVGDSYDADACRDVEALIETADVINLAGKITPRQFAFLVERSHVVLSNDSATMHLANYYSRPVVGVFGPTDPQKYGYISERSKVAAIDREWREVDALSDDEKRSLFDALTPDKVIPLVNELLNRV
jgi:ADP-heptose:LPS heptosyltransferase